MIPGTKKGVASFSDITENKRAKEDRLKRKSSKVCSRWLELPATN